MDYIEITAKTVEDAVTDALVQLGTTSDQIEYEVIEKGTSEWLSYDSQMILNNNMIGFILMTACLCGLGTAFYGALTMIFSLLVQNRKCILVFPVLMWYFNQYMLNRIHLVPDSIQPSILFSGTNFISNLLDISEWAGIVYLAAYVGITYIITYLLIRIKLQRV